MSLYLDSSALSGILIDEPTSLATSALLARDPDRYTDRHTAVEVRRIAERMGPALVGKDPARAIELLVGQLDRVGSVDVQREMLGSQLIVRTSTAPPRERTDVSIVAEDP